MRAAEFDSRIERVRREVIDPRRLDLLLVYADDIFAPGNVRYLTNFDLYAAYALVAVPRAGEVSLLFGMHHSAYLIRVKEVARAGYFRGTRTPGAHCRELAEELGARNPRVGLVGSRQMFGSIRADLERELPGAWFCECTDDFERLRLRKSPAELGCLRESARIAEETLRAARAGLSPGRTEIGVVADAGLAARRAGADVVNRELVAFRVASGAPVRLSPGPPGNRTLREGDAFAIEVSPQFDGYRAVLGRTFAVGDAGPGQRELAARVAAVHGRILSGIKPGVRGCEVARNAAELRAEAGLPGGDRPTVGHGIGLDMAEAPRLDLSDRTELAPGMALVVRTAVVEPAAGGVFLADTLLVDQDGPVTLSEDR